MKNKQQVEVHGEWMAYVERGEGDPIVLLHGNPTSSYLWRDVIPHLEGLGRCIAPDLIGMGDSAKLPGTGDDRYRFVEHRRYLDAFLEEVGVGDRVVLVVHDWGSGLGFDWANRHRSRVAGIAYMESIVAPVTWEDWPESGRGIFQGMRSETGQELCLDRNVFVERILPASIVRELSEEEMEEYRRPFREPGEPRRPTLTWPREIPIDGEPRDVHQIVESYSEWLAQSDDLPKLYIDADPGFLSQAFRDYCRTWPNQEEVSVAGIHFVQEDSADAIGEAIADWIRRRVRG